MSGCSMYRMQKTGKSCIKSLPYLINSGSLREKDVDKIAEEEKFRDWDQVMSSDAWPSYFMAMSQISMCTCLIEENLSGDRISDWHDLLEGSAHFQSWDDWDGMSECMRILTQKVGREAAKERKTATSASGSTGASAAADGFVAAGRSRSTSVDSSADAAAAAAAAAQAAVTAMGGLKSVSQRDFLGLPTVTEMEKQDGDYQVWLTYRRWKEFSEDDKSFSAVIKAVGKHKVFSSKWDSYLLKYKTNHAWSNMKESEQVDRFFDEMMEQYPATGFYAKLYKDCQDAQQAGSQSTRTFIRTTKQLIDEALEAAQRAGDKLDELNTEVQQAMFIMARLRKEVKDDLSNYLAEEGLRRQMGHELLRFDDFKHFETVAITLAKKHDDAAAKKSEKEDKEKDKETENDKKEKGKRARHETRTAQTGARPTKTMHDLMPKVFGPGEGIVAPFVPRSSGYLPICAFQYQNNGKCRFGPTCKEKRAHGWSADIEHYRQCQISGRPAQFEWDPNTSKTYPDAPKHETRTAETTGKAKRRP